MNVARAFSGAPLRRTGIANTTSCQRSGMPPTDHKVPRLIDRALIGVLILLVLVLLGIQVVHAG